MTERLTKTELAEKYETGYYGECDKHMERYIKLSKLEDILEKYGIESVEQLATILKLIENDNTNAEILLDECRKTEHDRDTWKKACGVACEEIRLLNKHLKYNLMSEDFAKKRQKRLNNLESEFYQQAQKEMNNEH